MSDLVAEAEALADDLEQSLRLTTTRIEWLRVAGQAARARALAGHLSEALQPATTAGGVTPRP